jgi:predicted LPLAT superfamily acyltransferase
MHQPLQWDGTSKGSVPGNRIFMWLIGHVGLLPAYCLLIPVSLYYALFDFKSIRVLRLYWAHLGKKAGVTRLWRHFFRFGMSLLDRYMFLLKTKSPFSFRTINEQAITAAVGEGKGVILLSAHLGNWEIAGNLLFDRTHASVNFTMVDAEKSEIKGVFDKAIVKRRVAIIPIGRDSMAFIMSVRDALRRGEIVCMHGDRMFGSKGMKKEFLGGWVEFPLGPFAMAAITGAPIIPIFAVKKGLRTYEFKAGEMIAFPPDSLHDRDKLIEDAVEKYVKILEQAVKENPYEWFNFYDFWASPGLRPPPQGGG